MTGPRTLDKILQVNGCDILSRLNKLAKFDFIQHVVHLTEQSCNAHNAPLRQAAKVTSCSDG